MQKEYRNMHIKRASDFKKTMDFIPTPPDVTQSLLDVETFEGEIWEPACGCKDMSKVLEKAGYKVRSSDIIDRGGHIVEDFLTSSCKATNIITNPPYALINDFWEKACKVATGKVAMLGRIQFLEGQKRYRIFLQYPPSRIYVFSKRASFKNNMYCHAWFVRDAGFQGDPIIKWLM